MIAAATIIAAALAGADHDAGVMAGSGLADLDVNGFMMQRDLAGHRDATQVRSQIVAAGRKAELGGEMFQTLARLAMKTVLLFSVIGARRYQFMGMDS